MAIDAREPQLSLQELRIAEGNRIADTYKRVVQREFGTAFASGSDPSKWKPYHVLVQATETNYLKRNFSLALEKNPPDLRRDDIAAMTVESTLFHPDYNNLYFWDPKFAISAMKKSGVFTERDYAIANGIARASVVKASHDSPIVRKNIDDNTDYAVHKKIYNDTVLNVASRPDNPFLLAVLGVERLIESDAIRMKDGSRTLRIGHVMSPDVLFDPRVLEEHFTTVEPYSFGEHKYTPQLSTTPYEPQFTRNKEYFTSHMLPLAEDSSRANLGIMIRDAAKFSNVTLPGLS